MNGHKEKKSRSDPSGWRIWTNHVLLTIIIIVCGGACATLWAVLQGADSRIEEDRKQQDSILHDRISDTQEEMREKAAEHGPMNERITRNEENWKRVEQVANEVKVEQKAISAAQQDFARTQSEVSRKIDLLLERD